MTRIMCISPCYWLIISKWKIVLHLTKISWMFKSFAEPKGLAKSDVPGWTVQWFNLLKVHAAVTHLPKLIRMTLMQSIIYFAERILWSTSSREELWATWKVPKMVLLFFFIFSACEHMTIKYIQSHTMLKEHSATFTPMDCNNHYSYSICLPPLWPPIAAVLHFASWCCSTAPPPHGWAAATSVVNSVVTSYYVTPTPSLPSSKPCAPTSEMYTCHPVVKGIGSSAAG